jgi:hypothetical protein
MTYRFPAGPLHAVDREDAKTLATAEETRDYIRRLEQIAYAAVAFLPSCSWGDACSEVNYWHLYDALDAVAFMNEE